MLRVLSHGDSSPPSPGRGRPRPAIFRALGNAEPPLRVEIDGVVHRRREVFKHDSWAATALYEREHADVPERLVVCKFNRTRSILGVSMGWAGRWLARREREALQRLADVPGVPPLVGRIRVEGQIVPNAVGHVFVPGRPLCHLDAPSEAFFRDLARLLDDVHARGLAYVDLHKAENVLVGDDGRPYLIDFQISLRLADAIVLGWVLSLLQQSDRYHFAKHVARLQPDFVAENPAWAVRRPWWIRLHRGIAVPFRRVRRRLLVLVGVRTGRGGAETEHAPELAIRRLHAAAGSSTPARRAG